MSGGKTYCVPKASILAQQQQRQQQLQQQLQLQQQPPDKNSESDTEGKNSRSDDKEAQSSESDTKENKSENDSKDESSEGDNDNENFEGDNDDENFEGDDEDENSESDTEDNNNCGKCVKKTNIIQRLTLSNEKAKCKLEDLEESYYCMMANEQIDIADYSENSRNWFGLKSKIRALEKSNTEGKVELEKVKKQLQTEVSSKKSLEESVAKYQKLKQLLATKIIGNENQASENYVEWFELNSKIQALEKANDEAKTKLETEATSAKKALEKLNAEAKVELEKVENQLQTEVASAKKALEKIKAEAKIELEKVENQLQTEVASKKSLEESLAKYQKLKQLLATKIFQSNPSNEDLIALLNLEIEKLFEKYDQIIRFNKLDRVKEEVDCTMKDKKLDLQILQRELYEKELDEIMDVLKMPSGDRTYTNILPMIKGLLQQVDTDHCTNAVENLINMNE